MDPSTKYRLVVADHALKDLAITLLRENHLPTVDIDEDKILFALLQNNLVAGTGGLEIRNNCALLRSISVKKDLRRTGIGKYIVTELEKFAIQKEVKGLYLFTNTAKDFFLTLGYEITNRNDLPAAIKNTSEYLFSCPSSAIAMKKFLS